jgi:DNA polymerase
MLRQLTRADGFLHQDGQTVYVRLLAQGTLPRLADPRLLPLPGRGQRGPHPALRSHRNPGQGHPPGSTANLVETRPQLGRSGCYGVTFREARSGLHMDTTALSQIASCSACLLGRNQRPLLDIPRLADVFWVGLSAVKVHRVETTKPLASDTRSGKLVEDIEARLDKVSFYRTNLVKCYPESNGKIRYPRRDEMKCCFPNLVSEVEVMAPRVVLLLGRQVANYVFIQLGTSSFSLGSGFDYTALVVGGVAYVPVHHPSYVLVYQRGCLASYIDHICRVIREHVPPLL